MRKSGEGISIEYVITIAISLVVLVILILFFTGALKDIVPKTENLANIDSNQKQIWKNICKTSCLGGRYCEINYKVDSNEDGKIDEIYICNLKTEKTVKEILKKEKVENVQFRSLDTQCDTKCNLS